ncbi:hypothetical protein [Pontibacterium sp.]|uniref:hypothetical protein n=1 Tax=Pontibacterium sp. TaxID=2036026 RepID=UPI003563D23A
MSQKAMSYKTMSHNTLSTSALEQVYDQLAEGVTQAGVDKEALFLTKLALLLANQVGDADQVSESIHEALKNL